jgi:hypothetical protein
MVETLKQLCSKQKHITKEKKKTPWACLMPESMGWCLLQSQIFV